VRSGRGEEKGTPVLRRTTTVFTLLLVTALSLPAAAAAARKDRRAGDVVPGSYIVVYKDSAGSVNRETDERERRKGFKSRFRYGRALKGFSARLSDRQLAELRADPEVDYITPNRTVRATAALTTGELVPTGIGRMLAATPNPAGSANVASSVGVAVIDTGIDLGHGDLNAADGANCITPGTAAQDDNGHGTHVAGTIAGENDGAGVVGVAPGTRVHAVKVLNAGGGGTWEQVICGINWVTAHTNDKDIKVANMSLGGLGSSADNGTCGNTTALHDAICNSTAAGVRYAVAAGNDAWAYPHPTLPDVPASYDEVLAVTASSDSDGNASGVGSPPSCRTGEIDERYATFSNWSDNATDSAHTLAAPGVCIRSTWPRSLAPAGGYHTISGTSMASPHVAGAVARCIGELTADGSSVAGACAGSTAPAEIIPNVTSTAIGYGFCGAPNQQPVSGRYYGYEALAGPAPSANFALCASPSSRTVSRGKSTTYAVSIARASGFTGAVSLSVSGLRSGATATFSPNPTSSTSSTLTIRTTSRASKGTVTLTIKGVNGSIVRGTSVKLQVK
jgi:subtilisin